jgi:hypothetical protein
MVALSIKGRNYPGKCALVRAKNVSHDWWGKTSANLWPAANDPSTGQMARTRGAHRPCWPG